MKKVFIFYEKYHKNQGINQGLIQMWPFLTAKKKKSREKSGGFSGNAPYSPFFPFVLQFIL